MQTKYTCWLLGSFILLPSIDGRMPGTIDSQLILKMPNEFQKVRAKNESTEVEIGRNEAEKDGESCQR
jgi:hypothetical protein